MHKEIIAKQRHFFSSHKTLDVEFRIKQLEKLLAAMKSFEGKFFEALRLDLSKPELESLVSETGAVTEEIKFAIKNLPDWASPQKVSTPLIAQPGRSAIYPEPKGVVLIISPWNYPVSLALMPLVGAISAGNCAILKPSELTPYTSKVIETLIRETFPAEYIYCACGDENVSKDLLTYRFDHIFFTGSTHVGKIVMKAAAEYLTSVTLELGGKSPCIVDSTASLDVSVNRIIWGKFFNAGQTCVAPDYVLVHNDLYEPFLQRMKERMRAEFGEDPSYSPDYARIVNDRHFDRLLSYMSDGKILCGGGVQKEGRYIQPTALIDVNPNSKIMSDEIFGPIIPILSFSQFEVMKEIILKHPNPLALYVFTEDADFEQRVLDEIPAGGVCINDTVIHVGCNQLPFGGRGESGMGAYHGKASFDVFTHFKSVLKKSTFIDPKFRYRPYSKRMKAAKWLMG
jgi:aldehyde dehydrogenase (NAD+)